MNRSVIRSLAVVVVCACVVGCRSDPDPKLALTQRLDPLLHRLDSSGAIFAARVIELPSGRELYAYRADEPMIPASNGKLANAAAGLDHFGPHRTFKTYLAIDGEDLWLIGTGDPAPGDEKIAATKGEKTTTMLDRWSEALRARGIARIRGNFYFYDGIFDAEWYNKTWSKGFATDWYAAPVTGLSFNDNCIDVTVSPAEEGQPAKVEVVPPTTDTIKIENKTRTGGPTSKPAVERDRENNLYTLTGNVRSTTKLESKPVTDPGAFFADAVRTNLASHGITIDGKTLRSPKPLGTDGVAPPADKVVATHETSMHDVLWRINKNSQNLFAEALCKLQGREWNLAHGRDEPGSWNTGGDAIRDFLRRQKIEDARYVLIDGSGLARGNRVTTRLISDVMLAMSRHPYADEWRKSLSIAGQDGTIGKRMYDIAGRVYAKTGFIGGVRSLSGYVQTRKGKWLAFSIIYNKIPGAVKPFEEIQDDACRLLVAYPNVERAELRTTTQPTTAPAATQP